MEVGGRMEKSTGEKDEQERLYIKVWFLKPICFVKEVKKCIWKEG